MEQFVSEALSPLRGTFDAAAMARGLPGLPSGFVWRGQSYTVDDVLERWKASSREGGRASGELYLRRHYYRLRMNDGSLWTVYFLRQTPQSSSPRVRWFLYAVETA